MDIELDPGTICARTNAGEVELQEARSGLTLPQRKALSLLAAPQAFAELAAAHHLDPVRLARDLVRLAEIGLIVLLVPAARSGRNDSIAGTANAQRLTTAVAGSARRTAMLPIAILAALALAIAIAWLGLRSAPAPAATSVRPLDPRAASPAAIGPATETAIAGADSESTTTLPAPARVRSRAASAGAAIYRN